MAQPIQLPGLDAELSSGFHLRALGARLHTDPLHGPRLVRLPAFPVLTGSALAAPATMAIEAHTGDGVIPQRLLLPALLARLHHHTLGRNEPGHSVLMSRPVNQAKREASIMR